MPKTAVTVEPGQALTGDALKLIAGLRARLRDEIPKIYNTDFNIYRWISSAQKTHRCRSNKDIIDKAEKNLRNHLGE